MNQDRNTSLVEFNLDKNISLTIPVQITSPELEQLPTDLYSMWNEADLAGKDAEHIEGRGAAIASQCLVALIKCSISNHTKRLTPDLLVALVRQKIWSTDIALSWIELMADQRRRVESLLALAPLIPKQLMNRLLKVLRDTRPYKSARPVPEVANSQQFRLGDGFYISESLGVILQRDSAPDHFYVNTLAKLTHFLPTILREKAIDELLEIIFDEQFFRSRNEPFAEIIQFLPESKIKELIPVAQKLPAFRKPEYDNPQAETLLVLLPRLAELGYTNDALKMVRKMSPTWPETALCLNDIARIAPEIQRFELQLEARKAALQIKHPWFRQEALATIAVQLAQHDHFNEAITTARISDREHDRLWAEAQLLEYLPDSLGTEILEDILPQVTDMTGDVNTRWETLQCVAIQLARKGNLQRALDYVEKACSLAINWWEQTIVLSPIATHFAALGYGEELLERVREFNEWHQPHAFAVLARYLPPPLNKDALTAALKFQPQIRDWSLQAEVLANLTALLPENEQPYLVEAILAVGEQREKRDIEEANSWLNTLDTIADILPNLPERLQHLVVEKALAAHRDYGDDLVTISLLAHLVPRVNEKFSSLILEELLGTLNAIEGKTSYEWALQEISRFLPESEWAKLIPHDVSSAQQHETAYAQRVPVSKEFIPANLEGNAIRIALKEASSINSGYGSRKLVLQRTIPSLMGTPEGERYLLWLELVHALTTQRHRGDILSDIRVLAPVIQSLGGVFAVAKACKAIIQVGKWFP